MTTRKTFKARVRARMAKTGERYAAARRQLDAPAPEPPLQPAAVEPEAGEPAGAPPLVSDDSVRRATNRGWDDWFALLDAAGALAWPHPEIARWLVAEHGVGGWWAQNVTVGYERARGRRAANERPSGFSVTASRTVDVPVERLFEAFAEPGQRARWLDHEVSVRRATPPRTIRFDWGDGSRLVAGFSAKGADRSTVALEHERLPDAAAVEELRAFWRARLAALKEQLAASG